MWRWTCWPHKPGNRACKKVEHRDCVEDDLEQSELVELLFFDECEACSNPHTFPFLCIEHPSL